MKTTILNKYRLLYRMQILQLQCGGMCVYYVQRAGYTLTYILYMVCSYMESNSVLVENDDATSAVSPTRRGTPGKDVWNAESPTKRLFFLRSVNVLARLPKHKRPRCLRVVNSGIHAPHPRNLGGVILKPLKSAILFISEYLRPCRERPPSSLQ